MDIAICTEDSLTYNAFNFSLLDSDSLELKRRFLQCPACGGPAFFRKASFNGSRTFCFGARPHAAGCVLAAFDYERPEYGTADHDALNLPGSKIIVDFGYGSPNHFDDMGCTPRLGRDDRNLTDDYRPEVFTSRRPRSLLRMLIESPEFRNSELPIEVHDNCDFTVRELFVPLLDVTPQYLGQFRGFWGLLSDVRLSDDKKSVWFNSGGKDTISFRLDSRLLDDFNQRYRFNDDEDLAGAYILVFGPLNRAPRKILYCEIEDLNFMSLKFT